ncbi:hypothetical protein JCM30760_14150 [Thiomicrorhabdus hydrogeniphila]
MEDSSLMMWGLLFSSIGVGYFLYGKKTKKVVPLFIGIGLLVFPFFISNLYILVALGVAMVATPYFIRT